MSVREYTSSLSQKLSVYFTLVCGWRGSVNGVDSQEFIIILSSEALEGDPAPIGRIPGLKTLKNH